ncbi:hypothetical protein A2696_03910 [Candidatus Curtissbacteria bacterium RIFCSPHIGHO2_01_FULL_41_13]|uniref:Glycosyltransferase RgtA/B/C/D-like domain-containing protein n=1 Tax=Candidatus Curtissbacteria bacterium RIFCSPHIGHO2_01_FULL_41_13 TaxID=1797745 RepID=A0A1F5G185_9BACT|nr:MAG: hypothetical protein A2696_03910 [Candidatus Curtissbacteria bacterium RIFCSPHIGHO2_01_FULL_41_13]
MSKSSIFIGLLIVIAFVGTLLRLIHYDRIPPFAATQDEFFYPWAGMTLIEDGIPTAWSWFESYPKRDIVVYWGATYPLVTPWVEKPPLYSLITGSLVLLTGAKELDDVRLSIIRLIPVTLSFFTIFLTGLLAKALFGNKIGLLSALLYVAVPTIVMANRLSLVENLLTPIVLLALYIYSLERGGKLLKAKPYVLGFLSGLAVLTKNIGIALPIIFVVIYLYQRKWKEVSIIALITVVFALVHPLMGLYYDWNLFIDVMKDYQKGHALVGLPELTQTIFRFPVIGHKDKIFLDGAMLAGYLLLFSSPFWLKFKNNFVLLGFPFVYVVFLDILESGGTDFSYFGWHVFPLFPFLMILMSKVLYDLWQKPNFLQSLFFYLILGSSTVRFFLLLSPVFQRSWQWLMAIFLIILIGGFALKRNYQRLILTVLFAIFLIVNILVVINLNQIYPGFPQPFQ